jgi:hypothetical protein
MDYSPLVKIVIVKEELERSESFYALPVAPKLRKGEGATPL